MSPNTSLLIVQRYFASFSVAALLGTLLLPFLLPLAALGQEPDEAAAAETRAHIEQLEAEIAAISRKQRSRESERDALQSQLRETELQQSVLSKRADATQSDIRDTRAEIETLLARRENTSAAASQQETAIAEELRASYIAGGSNELRLLLGQDNPQQIARLLAYYRYVLAARSDLIDGYRQTLAELLQLESSLASTELQLTTQLNDLQRQQRELDQVSRERQQLLAVINERIASDDAVIAARESERAQLENLLAEIEEALAQLFPEQTVEPFSQARGAMPWPVQGRIAQRFGRPRNQGKMRWQGVRLEAEAGTPVNAIHHGRVVYADWLRGSGLLLVLDHGEGYMSLYAHNETLLREVGDWVAAGVPVSTVGNSGGQSDVGLYFEIRKDGKPTDPQAWCSG